MKTKLEALYLQHFGCSAQLTTRLPASGSNRSYYRISGDAGNVIGALGTDFDENNAFISLARHFRSKGINVPQVYAVSEDGMAYLQEDLGDESLYDKLAHGRECGQYSEEEIQLMCKVVRALPKIQFIAAQDLDYNICYPDKEFNSRLVDFDLNYFKYCFLKTSGVEFNEIRLQDDFDALQDDLLDDFGGTFMYRDFQARNILWHQDKPWFIDFQGGRRGPMFYDIASFVWQASSHFSPSVKKRLTDAYLDALKQYATIEEKVFHEKFRLFSLYRTLQVLGAYGFRGLYEKKSHFIKSIPYAINNLRELLAEPFGRYPYLSKVLKELISSYAGGSEDIFDGLTVEVRSFSYHRGIPEDRSGNGGGFVFDCRALHNPGRYEQYRNLCGRDSEVISFLEENSEISAFLNEAYAMSERHVANFIERGFDNMQINFGCTGGRHRSVYCAEHMAKRLKEQFPQLRVKLTHRELGIREIYR